MAEWTGKPRVRTLQQNKALHALFTELSNELNDRGITIQKFLGNAVEIDFTPKLVKELIWKPLQEFLTGKDSTTKLDKTEDIGLIYDHLNRNLGELYNIFVEFPHKDPNDEAPTINHA